MSANNYRPEIDGLRAVAVVAVILFHAELGCPGGFVGVDVFFVISGFLITGIIQRGIETDSFSLLEFWERRISRIFPALFVMVAATLAAGYWFLLPSELEDLGESSLAQSLLLANVYFWKDTGYFGGSAQHKPLLHTWSLALEEQFYILLPLALCFVRRISRKKLFALLSVVALLSFAAGVYGTMYYPRATFYLLPTRAWELLIGCLLAIFPWRLSASEIRDRLIAFMGMLAIALPIFVYDPKTPFPGLAAVPPVVGTAAVIFSAASTPNMWICKVLAWRPVVFVGLISYSLYLWHWPLFVYMRLHFGVLSWAQTVFACLLAFLLAVLSWKFIERPFRNRIFLQRRRRLFGTAFALSGVAILASVFLIQTDGMSGRLSESFSDIAQDVKWKGSDIKLKAKNSHADLVIFGDSHAMALSHTINRIAKQRGASVDGIFYHGVLALPNVSRVGREIGAIDVLSRINEKNPTHVALIFRWSLYTVGSSDLDDEAAKVKLVDEEASGNADGANAEIIQAGIQRLVDLCAARCITLWIMKEVPETGEHSPARQWCLYMCDRIAKPSNRRRSHVFYQERTAEIEKVFRSIAPGAVRFLDPAPMLFDDEQMTINYDGQRALYRDNDHLTRWGARRLEPLIEEIFGGISAETNSSGH